MAVSCGASRAVLVPVYPALMADISALVELFHAAKGRRYMRHVREAPHG